MFSSLVIDVNDYEEEADWGLYTRSFANCSGITHRPGKENPMRVLVWSCRYSTVWRSAATSRVSTPPTR